MRGGLEHATSPPSCWPGDRGVVAVWGLNELDVIHHLPGQGAAFVSAGVAFVADIAVSVLVSVRSIASLHPLASAKSNDAGAQGRPVMLPAGRPRCRAEPPGVGGER